jgi:predicted amidohydrolase
MTSTERVEANLLQAERFALAAARRGADLVAFPENFAYLRADPSRPGHAEPLDGPIVRRMRSLASGLGLYILAGSVPEKIPGEGRIHNTSVLLGPDGAILAVYRKIHLFDVRIPGKAVFEESRIVVPGTELVVAETPLGRLGLSICYDLRFPELYRELARRGAEVLFVPSAFTAYTGRSHWLPLLRARAIENLCWLVAPAQTGRHGPARRTYGHTAIVDPWGRVAAMRASGPGLVFADVDLEKERKIRRELPCLEHVRLEVSSRPAEGS